jgi:hypothetical protein
VADSCEYGNKISASRNDVKYLDQLNDFKFLKKTSAPLS